jgi:hypothetical protein
VQGDRHHDRGEPSGGNDQGQSPKPTGTDTEQQSYEGQTPSNSRTRDRHRAAGVRGTVTEPTGDTEPEGDSHRAVWNPTGDRHLIRSHPVQGDRNHHRGEPSGGTITDSHRNRRGQTPSSRRTGDRHRTHQGHRSRRGQSPSGMEPDGGQTPSSRLTGDRHRAHRGHRSRRGRHRELEKPKGTVTER